MHQIGTQNHKEFKQIIVPISLLAFLLSLLFLLIWTVVLPSTEDNSEQLHNLIGTALWCIWGLIITLVFSVTLLRSSMVETEPQIHFVLLICWSSVFTMYSTLFLHLENKGFTIISINSSTFYQLEKMFFAVSNLSISAMLACRVFVDYLISTSVNRKRIAVTSATIVMVSASLGFFINARESITVLLIFLVPTLVSTVMIIKRKYMDVGINDDEEELSQESLTLVFISLTVLTIPYQLTLFMTLNKVVNTCFIRLSLWKSLVMPIILLLSHKKLRNKLIKFTTDGIDPKCKTLESSNTDRLPVTKRRAFSDPPPRMRRYGSMRSSSVTLVTPIIEENEEEEEERKDSVM